MITSTSNPKLKRVRRLLQERRLRQREQAFVVESTRWLRDLVALNWQPELVLYSESWQTKDENALLLAQLSGTCLLVEENLLQSISDTERSAGILAVVPMKNRPLPTQFRSLLILDQVTTPGNLGAILRTAAAAGVDGLLLAPGCVDPYNPKVVRAAMGAHLRLPLQQAPWPKINGLCQGLDVWLADSQGDHPYTAIDWTRPHALIIGNEANGPGPEARRLARGTVYIPMQATTESLNAAIAAGILLFEAARQRRLAAGV